MVADGPPELVASTDDGERTSGTADLVTEDATVAADFIEQGGEPAVL
jgi:hypothetical protein